MTTAWTLYIAILVLINILACFWLLWWTRKKKPTTMTHDTDENATTGHVWDEDLREYNKPLPKWWLNMFYISIVYSLGYLVFYPGLGGFSGLGGWSSVQEMKNDQAVIDQSLAPIFAKYKKQSLTDLRKDSAAQALGASIFANNCSQCHGSDARGAKGFPNLTDADWLWGNQQQEILTSILDGRVAAMPAWGSALGDQGVAEVAVYVQGLSGQKTDATLSRAGKARYETLCASCHGLDGKGNHAMGAPNLTDDIWLYGGDFKTLTETISKGRNGRMPAHRDLIGETRAKLAASWVLEQAEN